MQKRHQGTTRKEALICAVFLFGVGIFAGCGNSSSHDRETNQEEPTRRAEKNGVAPSAVNDTEETPSPLPALRSSEQSDSGAFFNQGAIPRVVINADEDSLRRLERDPRTFVRIDVQVDGVMYRDVGMHLKGRRGSFRPLDSKPGLTLKFNEFRKGQRFHGLEKIHLNNSVQDPSFMTEIICGRMFREAGVPAARATNARVQLNGRTLGFYVLVEGITEDFLRQYFENPRGNLYDFPYTHDITSSAAKESRDRDRSDLRALADAAKERDLAKRWQRLGRVLDLDRFITYLAMEVMIWDWDCYAMCRNNYRVYHDPTTDKIVFMPHGMDQIFENPHGSILPVMKGLVAQAALETHEGRRLYFEKMQVLANDIFTPERMSRQIGDLRGRIQPVLAALNPNAAAKQDRAVARLQQRIRERFASVQQQLKDPPQEPVPSAHFP